MAWLSSNSFVAGNLMDYSYLNNLANDIRAWGGNVNGGGYTLANVSIFTMGGVASPQPLAVLGVSDLPATTGTTKNGLLRLESSISNCLDIGLDNATPYGGWVQVFNVGDNAIHYPLLLNPNGGAVGIGITTPGSKMSVKGTTTIPASSGTTQTGLVRLESPVSNCIDIGLTAVSPYGGWIQVSNVGSLAIQYPLLLNPNGGRVAIGKLNPGSALAVVGLPTYADNTAASGGGLTAGDFYRTATGVLGVVF